jgi:mannitol/fructose-specific phosphotransferase system IIA component (Ntr-type)
MLSLFKELDFSSEIEENKDLKLFILEACKKVEQEESELLRKIRKPELDDELLNQFISTSSPTQSTASPS